VQGGTSSSKTFSILPLLIQYALQNAKSEISIVAESIPHLKRGAIRDFLKILYWTDNYIEQNFNRSSYTYIFSNGSYIEFFSADHPDKLRGARRDILFINECNNVDFESYQQLAIRTKKFIYLDYNPTSEFWVHTEVLPDSNADFIILTYKDNEALDPAIIYEIEKAKEKAKTSEYWENWWRVYGLGQLGNLQGVIFDNWNRVDSIDYLNCKLVGLGLDWGFVNDPTAVVAVYQKQDNLYIEELLYDHNLNNHQIYNRLKSMNINRSYEIIADSAEPKSIDELHRLGLNIHPSKKGADSILNSIDILKRYNLYVTKNSTNLIKELSNYKWKADKGGKQLNDVVDAHNHAIDALRYVALNKLKVANSGKYFILQA
jgi:phage terminase large subunit